MTGTAVNARATPHDPLLPAHIAIIMDGNGRWARMKGQPRTAGHREGLEVAKRVVKAASDMGIPFVTLYTFSTENWKRAEDEVGFLMGLIKGHLRAELAFYRENQIRVLHAGDLAGLPAEIAAEIGATADETAHFTGTTVVLAINYGGRDEIVRALRRVPQNEAQTLTESSLRAYLDVPDMPDVDLLIRTGGERRISNFLLWQSAYAELYFSDALWPDWTADDLRKAIEDYKMRDRRYGGIK
jgi:undecaprenyl diphosphate synthase